MRLLALAAAAAALASVMALSVGTANAQPSRSDFYEFACIDSKGQCYTDDSVSNPLPADGVIGTYGGKRFVNLYRPGDSGDRYVNVYRDDYGYGLPAPGLFGIALGEALANYPDDSEDRFVNYAGDGLVIEDNVAACEARYRSYDASTGLYLGYDGNYHPCRL
jgi:hypothetical protein